MNLLADVSQKHRLAALLLTLGLLNALVWGTRSVADQSPVNYYSTGTAFSSDGTVLRFSDKFQMKAKAFSFSAKYIWNNKINTMQEIGTTQRGLWGDVQLTVNSTSSFGPSLLGEVELDDELLLTRSYMQSGQATMNILPLTGDFAGLCYYLIYMHKVYCGTNNANPLPGLESPLSTANELSGHPPAAEGRPGLTTR